MAAMRYPEQHKAATRRRIVAEAGRLFRRHGYDGVGIDDVMAAARLTRGGFYGYFRSKADLLAAVMADEHGFIRLLRARPGPGRAALARQALAIVADYLHPGHRERVGRGCHLAALSVDTARAPRPVRAAYAAKVRELAAEFARGLTRPSDPDPRALVAIALCLGGLTLARGVDDEALAATILDACRVAAGEQLARP
jgi:TetR/AcrR family transcriptional repressor of nem operon